MPSITTPSTPPPTNQRAEQVALAGIFSNSLDPILLEPDHFADPANATILRVVRFPGNGGASVTAVSLAAGLGSALNDVGGLAYLAHLEALAPTPEAVTEAAAQVRDAWLRRQLIDMGERLQQIGLEAVQDAFGVTSRASGADQALQVHRLLLATAMDMLSIVIAPPATVAQAAEIGAVPGSRFAQITPFEMERIADINVHLSAHMLATEPDRAAAHRLADLHLARAKLFRDLAKASSLP